MPEKTDDKNFQKKKFINFFAVFFTLAWFMISIIINVIYYDVTDFSAIFDFELNHTTISLILSNFITGFVCLYLSARLYNNYKKRGSIMNLALNGFFFFSGFASLIVGFDAFISYNSPTLSYFFTLTTAFIMPASTFFLAIFLLEMFYDGMLSGKNKVVFIINTVMAIGVLVLGLVITLVSNGEDIEGIGGTIILLIGALYIGLNIALYSILTKKSKELLSNIEDPKYKKFLSQLSFSGIALVIAYISRLVIFLIFYENPILLGDILGLIIDFVYLTGYLALYRGISSPLSSK